jgi:hypothetical protein
VDKTKYRAEHDWLVVKSVFDEKSCSGTEVEECGIKAQWTYTPQTVVTRMEDKDIELDYGTEYYQKYKDSFESSDEGDPPALKDGEVPLLSTTTILMPTQSRTHDENANGIHWKVSKRTPVFKGADFFVRFYKKANEPVSYLIQGNEEFYVSFKEDLYRPLDYTWDDSSALVTIDPQTDPDFKRWANEAVRSSKGKKKSDLYNFYTQPYYIIEMFGIVGENKSERYFIIIPFRGNPIFVHFFQAPHSDDVVARRLGPPFKGVHGRELINSNYFDVSVRNHLGRLVIQFDGDGFNDIPPWIVERRDWVAAKSTAGGGDLDEDETPYMTEEYRELIVPKGHIALWGGNIRCGFLFGILQYESGTVSFPYPPRHVNDSSGSDEDKFKKAFEEIDPRPVTFSADYFESDPLWLPLNRGGESEGDEYDTAHRFLFEAYNGPFRENGVVGDQEPTFENVPLFSQDAQYYKNYVEETKEKSGFIDEWLPGFFHYNMPIREFSSQTDSGPVKTSNIVIKKYKYLNYERTRHQGFNTYVGMMCGDHYFTEEDYSSFWSSWNLHEMEDVNDNTDDFSYGTETGWYLRNCKTPILTSVRLISDPSNNPRWEDGTTISYGVKKDPETDGTSPYFVDATDHVMNFSHSWTSSSMTSLEHSGTIQFYLNHNMITENMGDFPYVNNVTDELLSLQDKTFYIEIWAGYRDLTWVPNNGCDNPAAANYSRIPGFYKMFTGLCSGGSLSYEYNKHVMTCQIKDYSVILKNMLFFNSPWFDAMKDAVAIREILRMAGFRDQGVFDPLQKITEIADDSIDAEEQVFYDDISGRVFKYKNFGLPSGYNRLEQPALKFNDGDPFMDAISKISSYSAKIFYFDEFGIAHYEDYQDLVEEDFENELPLVPLYAFTTNPLIFNGQQVFNKLERSFDVDSVVSHLKTITNTPDMHMLIRDRIRWESIENPESAGFIGYQKTFYQAESMFGSKEAQISAMNKYAVMFKPIIGIRFETYGVPLRATDIISIDDEIVRVIKVDHNFDASKNQWWMNVDCQRFQPISVSDLMSAAVAEEE